MKKHFGINPFLWEFLRSSTKAHAKNVAGAFVVFKSKKDKIVTYKEKIFRSKNDLVVTKINIFAKYINIDQNSIDVAWVVLLIVIVVLPYRLPPLLYYVLFIVPEKSFEFMKKKNIHSQTIREVYAAVAEYYQKNRRMLPWRDPILRERVDGSLNPYRILVSELMLQQTQVSRVLVKYSEFIRVFPTVKKLAQAPFSLVLKKWQGLGYNRRAKFLHQAAQEIVLRYKGNVPKEKSLLTALSGVGEYTARAILVFAYNIPHTLIETNIRTVVFFHYYSHMDAVHKKIPDKEIISILEELFMYARKKGWTPREWYYALMDYGSFLKLQKVRTNHQSAHYKKQSIFKGSNRELRGALIRHSLTGKVSKKKLIERVALECGAEKERVSEQYVILQREGLIF